MEEFLELINLSKTEDFCKRPPKAILVSRKLYNLYYQILEPHQRFSCAEVDKMGLTSLLYHGIPVIPKEFPFQYFGNVKELGTNKKKRLKNDR